MKLINLPQTIIQFFSYTTAPTSVSMTQAPSLNRHPALEVDPVSSHTNASHVLLLAHAFLQSSREVKSGGVESRSTSLHLELLVTLNMTAER